MTRDQIDPTDEPIKKRRIEIKPAGYLQPDRPIPAGTRSDQRIVVARHGRYLADPQPDPQTPDVTGRYESIQHEPGSGGPVLGYLLHVNQAGKEVYGALVEVLDSRTKRLRAVTEFGGRRVADGEFALYSDDGAANTLVLDGEGVVVTFAGIADGHPQRFTITEGRRPTLFAEALAAMLVLHDSAPPEDVALLKALEATPLSFAQVAWLRELLSPRIIGDMIAEYHAVGGGIDAPSHLWRANAAEALDTYIGKVFSTQGTSGWHVGDLTQAQMVGRLMLTSDRHRFGKTTKSPIQWIEAMAAEVTQSTTLARDLPNLRQHLGIKATKGAKPDHVFTYDIKLELKAKTRNIAAKFTRFLKVEGFYGTASISLKGTRGASEAPSHTMWLAGGGIEASTKLLGGGDIDCSGTFATDVEWAPSDFLGWVKLLDAGYWAGIKPSALKPLKDAKEKVGPLWDQANPVTKHLDKTYEIVPSQRELALIIHGNGSHEQLIVPLQVKADARHGAGASFTVEFGMLMRADTPIDEVDYGRNLKKGVVYVQRVDKKQVNFNLGVALLRGSGRQSLRMFCAKELAWLNHEGSRMLIVGHADRLDTAARNIELSRLRALNVVTCLHDILGTKLRLSSENIECQWLGESAAAGAGIKDNRPSPEWRKVDIFVDGRQVLTLWGEA